MQGSVFESANCVFLKGSYKYHIKPFIGKFRQQVKAFGTGRHANIEKNQIRFLLFEKLQSIFHTIGSAHDFHIGAIVVEHKAQILTRRHFVVNYNCSYFIFTVFHFAWLSYASANELLVSVSISTIRMNAGSACIYWG